ncbi:MAG: hypothetical protein HUU29_00370 [Planctomycetaceae bacterium]|nr:hypothetical protein [Planctomycetaceae bacterium]
MGLNTEQRYRWIVILGMALGVLLFHGLALSVEGFDPRAEGIGHNSTLIERSYFHEYQVSAQPAETGRVVQTSHKFHTDNHSVALWLGASQLHTINRWNAGDELAVVIANKIAGESNARIRYVQLSAGNANIGELLCLYISVRAASFKPEWLIVAIVYDDFQEQGVRPEILSIVNQRDLSQLKMYGAGVKNMLDTLHADGASTTAPVVRNATMDTPQEVLEESLMNVLEVSWPAYSARHSLAAALKAAWTEMIVQGAFDIVDRPIVSIPKEQQLWNWEALNSLVSLAKADGVKILLYKQPHRPGEQRFYHDRNSYDQFHTDVQRLAIDCGLHYLDLESLVPQENWGITNAGLPDVFHFTSYGHRRLAQAIHEAISGEAQ